MAARLTGHKTDKIDRSEWRRVRLLTTPNTIIGWASLEHPDFQTVSPGDGDNTSVYALLLDEVKLWGSRNISGAFESWKGIERSLAFPVFGTGSVSTCRLLFVRTTADRGRPQPLDVYERVGVGRLFEPMVKSEFSGLERNTVLLG